MGITIGDLMPPDDAKSSTAAERRVKRNDPVVVSTSSTKPKQKLELVATYDYTDEHGNILFQKQRFVDKDTGKKTFRQRRKTDTGEWVYNLDGVNQVLYNLPEVLDGIRNGKNIVVVEGEKDVETLRSLGRIATTMPGGAGKWRENHTESLRGANVIVVADNDEPGKAHAIDVKNKLSEAGCTVRLMIPDGVKDVSDLIDSGGQLKELRDFDESLDGQLDVESQDESKFDNALVKIEKIFERDDLSDHVKMLRASGVILDLGATTQARPTGRLVKWSDFVNEDVDDSYDWIIPDVLERGERVMVVAAEGVGKTMLGRQVALCSAAGINPFTFERMKPITTLMVDLENPQRIIRRTSMDIQKKSMHYGWCEDPQAHLLIKPDGLDLLKSGDREYLEEGIEAVKPDLLLLGPVYKSFVDPGGRTSEAIAIEVAKYFDSLREWFNCAMWFEHHAPLGSAIASRDLRPFGSAVWSRWPEFGLSLQPDPTATSGYTYEVKHFRGARDQRKFPTKMIRGKTFPFEVIEFAKVD